MFRDEEETPLKNWAVYTFFGVCIVGILLNLWFNSGRSVEPKEALPNVIYMQEGHDIVVIDGVPEYVPHVKKDTKEEIDNRYNEFFKGVEEYERSK